MEGRQYDLHEADAMLRESGINAAPIVAMVEKALNGFYSSVGKDIYEIGSHIRSCAPAFSFSKIKDAARIVSESYAYINDHKEAWDCLNNDQLLSDFVSRLKWSRVESLLPGQEPAWGDIQSRCALLTSNITIFDFFQLYESIGPPAKPYRTAERSAIRTDYPKEMAVITDKRYQFALSFHRSDRAYLLLLRSLSGIPYRGKEGLLFEKNELQNRLANDGIANIDIALLCSVYSLLLAKYKKECMDEKNALTDTVDLYIPQFMEYTGLARNHSKQGVESMFTAIKQFKNVIGCLQMVEKAGPDYREVEVMRYYPALILTKYSKDHNTISLTSPYLARLVSIVFSESEFPK